jgi:tetratricopeptide (TPR) repeat protein
MLLFIAAGLVWWTWNTVRPAAELTSLAPAASSSLEPPVTFDMAMQQLGRYQVDDAEQTLCRVLERYPDSARSREELRWLYFNQFRQGELQRLLEEGLRFQPRNYALAVALLMSEFRPQNPREVLNNWVTAVEKQPNQPHVQATLGYCYARVGDRDRAEAALQTALELAPRDPLVLLRAIEFLVDQGAWESAQELLNEAQAQRPPAVPPALPTGTERADQAATLTQESPETSSEPMRPGELTSGLNASSSSASSSSASGQEDQRPPRSSRNIGNGGDNSSALDRYEDQLAWNASMVAESLGNIEQALQQIEVALAIHPDELRYVQRRGALLRLLGRSDEAARLLERANQLEACIGRLTEIVLSGQLENPSVALCRELAELCGRRGKLFQAQVWRRAAEELETTRGG